MTNAEFNAVFNDILKGSPPSAEWAWGRALRLAGADPNLPLPEPYRLVAERAGVPSLATAEAPGDDLASAGENELLSPQERIALLKNDIGPGDLSNQMPPPAPKPAEGLDWRVASGILTAAGYPVSGALVGLLGGDEGTVAETGVLHAETGVLPQDAYGDPGTVTRKYSGPAPSRASVCPYAAARFRIAASRRCR